MRYVKLGRTGLRVSRLCLGTMNFGPEATESGELRDHGSRARARHQLLRHRQRLRVEDGRRRDRADRRPLARAGRADGANGSCSPPRSTDAWGRARTTCASRRLTFAAPARKACVGSARIASTSTRCITSTETRRGTRSGRRWISSSRRGRSSTSEAATSPPGTWSTPMPSRRDGATLGLVSEQSLYNLTARTVELEVLPACRAHGVAVLPWSPLAGRPPRRRAAQGARGPARLGAHPEAQRTEAQRSSSAGKRSAASSATTPRTWRSPGRSPTRRSPRRSSDRERLHSSRGRSGRSTSRCRRRRSRSSTRSGPGRAGKRPRRTRGNPIAERSARERPARASHLWSRRRCCTRKRPRGSEHLASQRGPFQPAPDICIPRGFAKRAGLTATRKGLRMIE